LFHHSLGEFTINLEIRKFSLIQTPRSDPLSLTANTNYNFLPNNFGGSMLNPSGKPPAADYDQLEGQAVAA